MIPMMMRQWRSHPACQAVLSTSFLLGVWHLSKQIANDRSELEQLLQDEAPGDI